MDNITVSLVSGVCVCVLVYVFDRIYPKKDHPAPTGLDYLKIFVSAAAGTLLTLLLLGGGGGGGSGDATTRCPGDEGLFHNMLRTDPDF
jgi:hypothetical protein